MKIINWQAYFNDLPEKRIAIYSHPRLAQRLRDAVYSSDVLTEQERRAIILHIYESRDLIRCAGIMHISKQSILSAVQRGIKKLKKYLS